jgi:antibiotic biosynthesis monooxygenase (ABM) superfamily enzyme
VVAEVMEHPVTVMIERRVASGREAEFQQWNDDLDRTLSRFPGCLGTGLLRPSTADAPWHLVYRFDTAQHLRDWEESPERAALMKQAVPLIQATFIHRVTGLETWFSLPGRTATPPPRWKMFLVSGTVFYALNSTLNALYGWLFQPWPTPVRVLLVSYPVTAIATWLVMPAVAVRLRRWLHP